MSIPATASQGAKHKIPQLFVQFLVLAVAIAVIFYTPSIVQTLAQGIANALGVH